MLIHRCIQEIAFVANIFTATKRFHSLFNNVFSVLPSQRPIVTHYKHIALQSTSSLHLVLFSLPSQEQHHCEYDFFFYNEICI